MGWDRTGDGYHCTDCGDTFAPGSACRCPAPQLGSSAPTQTHTGDPGTLYAFLRPDEEWMQGKLNDDVSHLFSRAGRLIALANIYSGLDHEGTTETDVKRAGMQIRAVSAMEKLGQARDVDSRITTLEAALESMEARIAATQGNAGRIDMETPQADRASGGTDPRN